MPEIWTPSAKTTPESLEDGTIHFWCASLRQPPATFAKLREWLSPEELDRAGKYVFEKDREAFINARGILRRLLGFYLGRDPSALSFVPTGNDKPALPGRELHFNLSHSGHRALYGFTRVRDIGVDIELERPLEDAVNIAESYFSEREKLALRRVAPAEKSRAFFRGWARKEAFIKTYGEGLSRGLDGFDVSLEAGAPGKNLLLAVDGDEALARAWTLEELNPEAEYAAAYCIESAPAPGIKRFRFIDES